MAQAKKNKRFFLTVVLAVCFTTAAFRLLDDPITNGLIQKFEKYTQTYVPEKVYLHLDKPYYVAGEDIWFKGYLINGTSHTPTTISDNLYVELISPDGEIINRHILKVEKGFTNGDFELADSLETGTYSLRAYTNWMRNFPETYFFHRPVHIYNDRNYTTTAIKTRTGRNKVATVNATPAKPDLDVQFFPEGGNLVAGITTRIGFKALNRWGKGENITGSILDATGKELNSFKSAYFGMGQFVFLPAKNQTYTARIKTADGRSLSFPFPPVQDQGIVMQAINFPSGDIRVVMSQPETQFTGEKTYILIAQMRGVHFYAASVKPSKKDVFFQIPANAVPGPGIAQITLFDAITSEPLNERLIFTKPNQKIKLAIEPDKAQYKARERVQLKITATDLANNPVAGEFSLAVTDASLPPENTPGSLSSYFLLSSDLPGTVEHPDFYFRENNLAALQALDNLMLTQGWRRFVWKDILTENYPPLKFYPEQGLAVSGQINRLLTNKPLANAEVLLVNSGTDGFIIQTKTDADGRFGVNGLAFDSVRTLFVQAKNEKGKANTLVILDKTSFPPLQFLSPVPPEDITLSDAYIQKMKNQQKINDSYAFKNGERVLKEVQVTAKRPVAPEKTRIYGTADNVIKMTDQMVSFSNVLQALQGRVAGVNVTGGGANMQVSIRGGGEPLFLLDEIPVDVGMINSISPTDVETIEVLKGASAAIYGSRGGNGVIAIYTKRGGAVVDNRPAAGTTLGKIFGYYKAREFFSPRYEVAREIHNLPDLRSTIYWNPRIKTDLMGKATVTFYNADQINSLQVILEGLAPASGYFGSLTTKLPGR